MKFIIFCTAMLFLGCNPSESLDNRLNRFYGLLDNSVVSNFKQGQIDEVVAYLEKKINENQGFKEDYLQIKNDEGVDFFSTKQLVEFYYYSFFSKKKK